ncbi:MAG: hypothetical protein Kow00107_03420 [Planctomycetota bacterium]
MSRAFLLAILFAGLSLLFLPALKAEDGEWKITKTRFVELGKSEILSPVLKPGTFSGDKIDLPGGGFKVKLDNQKVLVDVKGKGTPDYTAAQGTASKPFVVDIVYADGTTQKYGIKVLKNGNSWAWIRNSVLEATIDRTKLWIADENCNGIYGEVGADAIYFDKKDRGCPFSPVVFAGGSCYEISVVESGAELKYKPYTGKLGKVDIFKDWNGKKDPETVLVQGNTEAGEIFLDIAAKGAIDIPLGSYTMVRAYLPGVEIIKGQSTTFEVGGSEPATMKWGLKLKVVASVSVSQVKGKETFTLNPVPAVEGVSGERYVGAYMEDARFKFNVSQATANGKPIGRPTTWSVCFS